jgi:hypothetical protein
MAVGSGIIVFGLVIPPRLGLSMEFAVGIMLVVLGVLTLTGMGRAVGAANTHEGVGAGHARGLHDHLHAHGDYVHRHPHLVGDAQEMRDNTGGGNDTLSANPDSSNQMYGDAYDMFDNARGGNDTLTGGLGTNRLIGDAYDMFDNARGGNDTLTGGRSANNEMYGDAYAMADNARGGDDTLIGGARVPVGAVENDLHGDASSMSGNARGGNDTLTGGAGATAVNNLMATPTPCPTTPAAATTR